MKPTTASSDPSSRTRLRQHLRRQRRALPSQRRAAHDAAIRSHLSDLVRARGIRSLAAYWPFDGEPDLGPLCAQLLSEGCLVGLPVVSPEKGGRMSFHAWESHAPLKPNRYGIMEPDGTASLALGEFDMLVMPLVGYDRAGNRLGMGAGYYDRHLDGVREADAPLRVGVAYELQALESIEPNAWDVPLHGLVNERGWLAFERS